MEYSIWLMPAEPWLGKFRSIIEGVARGNNTFSFEPHVTIMVKSDEEDKMIKVAEELAKQTSKITAKLTEIGHEDYYFRALYLKAERQKLFEIHTIARKLAGMLADPYYMPHLSLLYGNLDEKAKKKTIKRLTDAKGINHPDFKLPLEIEFDRITLWHTGADIPVNEWKCIVEFPLK